MLGARVRVGPEHDGRQIERLNGQQCLRDLALAVAVLGRDRVLRDEQERLGQVEAAADAELEQVAETVLAVREHLRDEVHPRAADDVDGGRVLAHADDPVGRVARGREVDVGELRHRVPDRLVDVARDLAAHRVRERDVHVGRGERGRHRLEAVADRDHDIGLEPVERGRKLEQAEVSEVVVEDAVVLEEVEQVRQLGQDDKPEGQEDDDGPPAALVGHEGRQPALKLVGERGDHQDEPGQQRQLHEHGRSEADHQSETQAEHGR